MEKKSLCIYPKTQILTSRDACTCCNYFHALYQKCDPSLFDGTGERTFQTMLDHLLTVLVNWRSSSFLVINKFNAHQQEELEE